VQHQMHGHVVFRNY